MIQKEIMSNYIGKIVAKSKQIMTIESQNNLKFCEEEKYLSKNWLQNYIHNRKGSKVTLYYGFWAVWKGAS